MNNQVYVCSECRGANVYERVFAWRDTNSETGDLEIDACAQPVALWCDDCNDQPKTLMRTNEFAFSHVGTISFTVFGNWQSGDDLTFEAFEEAVLKRLDSLKHDTHWREAFELFDTVKERCDV